MADRCVFFEDLLTTPDAVQRTYVVHDRGLGMVCIEARARRGGDWFYARRWIRSAVQRREIYRAMDWLELRGFAFLVQRIPAGSPRPALDEDSEAMREFRMRASEVAAGYTAEERQLHRELFPQEDALLSRGYDWDATNVYRNGSALSPDAFGRVLETDGVVVHEWVRVPEEFTWRRYPIGHVAAAQGLSTRPAAP